MSCKKLHKHYIRTVLFLWESRFLRLFFLYFRSETRILKQVILKSRSIHWKTPVLESLFNKAGLKFFIQKKLQHRYFPVNVAKFLRTAFVIATPVAAFDQTLIYTLKINELIVFSSCTVLSVCFYYKKIGATNKQIWKRKWF